MNATAQALVADTATETEATEAPVEASEDAELSAVWDTNNTEETAPETAPEPTDEAPDDEQADETSEVEAESTEEAPKELPRALNEHWKDIPEGAREAILESQRDLSRKLGDQGRLIQGIKPIQDVLVQATKDIPALAQMQPQDVAQEVMALAKVSADFQSKPVETIMSLVKQHGLEEPLRQVLGGEQPQQSAMQNNELKQEISSLRRQLAQVSDPDYVRSQAEQVYTQAQVQSDVDRFASTADHWSKVEDQMPQYIQAVRAISPDTSAKDVLKEAYELAVSRLVPEANKATPDPAPEAAVQADPAKTKAALKAKSVNVRSKPTGKDRTLTEDEELAAAYARMQE